MVQVAGAVFILKAVLSIRMRCISTALMMGWAASPDGTCARVIRRVSGVLDEEGRIHYRRGSGQVGLPELAPGSRTVG